MKYLLDQGALVNTRDKGGFGPLDHAAVNQDLELCALLLEAGASLLRDDNNLLVVRRNAVLDQVYAPDVYKLLHEALTVQINNRNEERYSRKLVEDDLNHKVYTTVHYYTLPYTTIHYQTLLYTTIHHYTLPYTTMHHYTLLYTTIHPYSPLYTPIHTIGSC